MRGNSIKHAVADQIRRGGIALALLTGAGVFLGAASARAAEGPVVIKTRVYVDVYQTWHAWVPAAKKFQDNATAWMPKLRFTVRGPIPSGSQISVDFTKPDGSLWWSLDCTTNEITADQWSKITTPQPSSTADEKKYSTGAGLFGFKIRLKNELSGINNVLFSGKYKVSKVSNFNGTPLTKNQFDYSVDHDWELPIGYLFDNTDRVSSHFAAAMWFKGEQVSPDFGAYLFYKGKEIGSTKNMGTFGTTDEEINTIHHDAGDPAWKLWEMEWFLVAPKPIDPDSPNEKVFYLSKNPGDYEIKVLRKGKLARSAKFSVGDDGKIVDPGIDAANNVNEYRMILPVKVLGTLDGPWNNLAWKTDALYGNPLKGFTVP